MPVYQYRCKNDHVSEDIRRVSQRHAPHECPVCGAASTLEVTPVAFDNLGMGVSTDFPTFASRWERIQRSKNTGKMWDSNNNRYGGEYEKQK